MDNTIRLIENRKSVRTFNGEPLSQQDVQKLKDLFQTITNPFGVPATFQLVDAKECGAGSPVIIGTDMYVGIKVPREQGSELACGYEIEQFCLEAEALGIGTVILAATIKRTPFERAMNVQPGEVMPVVTPVGYPADKRSVREKLMRKGLRADERLPFESLFFDGSFAKPLSPEAAGPFREALEMMRLAPSATNKQPWRAVVNSDDVYIYENQTLKETPLGDVQKVDVGIGICNFLLTMEAEGKKGSITTNDDPGLSGGPALKYIATYKLSS